MFYDPEKSSFNKRRLLTFVASGLASLAMIGCGGQKNTTTSAEKKIPGCNNVSVMLAKQGSAYYTVPIAPNNTGGVTDYFLFENDSSNNSLVVSHAVLTPTGEPLSLDNDRVVDVSATSGRLLEQYSTGGYIDLNFTRDGEKIGLLGRACTGILSSENFNVGPANTSIF